MANLKLLSKLKQQNKEHTHDRIAGNHRSGIDVHVEWQAVSFF
jgi:hypothetical protein